MRPQAPKHSPNWVDGMKITYQHFEQWEDVQLFRQQQNLMLGCNSFRYGLSYLDPQSNQPLSRSGNRIMVTPCAGLSQGGFPFRIPAYPQQELSLSLEKLDLTEKAWYIVLKIHLYERVSAGTPDPEEEPPRLPYSVPTYELRSAVEGPQGLNLSPNEVVLGRLEKTDSDAVELDPTYIPPCLQINVHPQLHSEVNSCISDLDEVVRRAQSVMRKIQEDPKKHKSELSQPLLHLSEWLIPRLIPIVQQYHYWGTETAPVYFYTEVSILSRLIQSALASRPERKSRELQLINYFIEGGMLDTKQAHSLESGMQEFHYLHHHLRDRLEKIKYFCNTLSTLFRKLDEENRYVWEKVNEHRIVFNPKGRHIDG